VPFFLTFPSGKAIPHALSGGPENTSQTLLSSVPSKSPFENVQFPGNLRFPDFIQLVCCRIRVPHMLDASTLSPYPLFLPKNVLRFSATVFPSPVVCTSPPQGRVCLTFDLASRVPPLSHFSLPPDLIPSLFFLFFCIGNWRGFSPT